MRLRGNKRHAHRRSPVGSRSGDVSAAVDLRQVRVRHRLQLSPRRNQPLDDRRRHSALDEVRQLRAAQAVLRRLQPLGGALGIRLWRHVQPEPGRALLRPRPVPDLQLVFVGRGGGPGLGGVRRRQAQPRRFRRPRRPAGQQHRGTLQELLLRGRWRQQRGFGWRHEGGEVGERRHRGLSERKVAGNDHLHERLKVKLLTVQKMLKMKMSQ